MNKKYLFIHSVLFLIALSISAMSNHKDTFFALHLEHILFYFTLYPMFYKLKLISPYVTIFLYLFNYLIIGVFIVLKIIRTKIKINILIINISIAFAYLFPLVLKLFGEYVGP